MSNTPRYTGQDNEHFYFEGEFQGHTVRMRKDKRTNEILFDASDCLKILGLGSDLNEFLSSDKGLDLISEYQKSHPNVDLFGKSGLFRKV